MNDNLKNNSDQLLDPKELAAAFEYTMNFVKGDTEALPDMMAHTGRLLLRLSRRLSTTQMVLLVGALTLGAIFVAKRVEDALDEDDDQGTNRPKALSGGSAGSQANRDAGAQVSGSEGSSSGPDKKGSAAAGSESKGAGKTAGTK